MDKTEQKVLDFMLHSSYTDVIHRSITGFLSLSFREIQSSIKIDRTWMHNQLLKYPSDMHHKIISRIHDDAFLSILNTDKAKKSLFQTLNETIKKKPDIIHQIMREFEIDKGSDSVYIFDQMGHIFDLCSKNIRESIKQGNWKELYERWREL